MLADALDLQLALIRESLSTCGKCIFGGGEISTDRHELSFHTCIGPASGMSSKNQDAIFLWVSENEHSPIKWACAIADGLGSSYFSEIASQLVVWASIYGLLHADDECDPADSALRYAHSELYKIAETLCSDHLQMRFRPAHLPASAYTYLLNTRKFLQTTICLVWFNGSTIEIASLGDSAILSADSKHTLVSHSFPDLDTHFVQALTVRDEDDATWERRITFDQSTDFVAVFTDGVAKSLAEQNIRVVDGDFDLSVCFQGTSHDILARLANTTSVDEADNMSLLLVKQTWPAKISCTFPR